MTTTQLICPECQRENEAERIFCHGCGARLDRSALIKEKPLREQPEQARQRLQRLLDPQRGKLRRLFFKIAKVVLGAAAAAAVIEIFLPLDLPPAVKRVGAPPEINFDVEKAIISKQTTQLQYNEEQVNAYLAYSLKSKQAALDKPLLTFKRLLVKLSEGNNCTITVERSLFGYSVFERASYQVQLREGKVLATSKGVWFGQLPVHPQAMKVANVLFADVFSALDREQKLIGKMGGIEIHDGSVVLTSPLQ
jgi:hypothetical protein